MRVECDCVVIGAGAVGLACARALAQAGRDVLILEAAETFGTATSSRNSEVIHAGLYYPEGSLKARFCRRGRDLLYPYLSEHGIQHLRCGKLVVATNSGELEMLRQIEVRARGNNVLDLEWLSGDEARGLEPELRCLAALRSPSTGIFDSHSYMLSLLGDAETAGASIAYRASVSGGRVEGGVIELLVEVVDSEPMTLACRSVVNCAGLGAQQVASSLQGLPADSIPARFLNKGSYFSLAGRPPFSQLVYPVPDHASIGLHYTRDLAGRGRFGPDTQWVDAIDYTVDPARALQFYDSIRRYWPGLKDGALAPDYAGVRPKLQSPTTPPQDFAIVGPERHGIEGLLNLFGIESPGLTSSLAIAEHVSDRLAG